MNLARVIIPNLTPEEEFILCCAATQLNRARFHRLISAELDWNRIDQIAALHRLRPLLFKHLKAEEKSAAVPQVIWHKIQRHAAWTAGRNLSQTNALAKTIRLLRDAGIEALPFKGPVLALRTYDNVALREFFDLDLLVRREDILKAKQLLHANGYKTPPEQNARESEHIDAQLGHDFLSADGQVRLELHWSFIQKWLTYEVDLAAIWSRAIPIEIAGVPTRTIAREDLLPYLCAHGAKHHWERLFWIIDIAEFLRAEKNLDTPNLLNQARANGNWRIVALGLYLAKTLLDAPLPELAWNQINIPPIAKLARMVGTWLFNEPHRPATASCVETKFYLGAKERASDRFSYAKHLLKLTLSPSDKDRAFVKLPSVLSFLYPAVRPVRWLVQR